jgi:hypothetical protein
MLKTIKKHRKIDSRIPAKAAGYVHIVSVLWRGQREYWWNDTCADIVEVFGLPGDRYTSHPSMDKMDFYFKSQRDADLCRILISEKI